MDNMFILDLKGEDQIKAFEEIIYKNMKPRKACDVYHLTVEHIRECGELAQDCIRTLVNMIIQNIYHLTCPQAKVGLGTYVHKGKGRPIDKSTSYRRVTVTL